MGLGSWHSIWLLLLLAPPHFSFSSVSPNRLIFDVTQVLNELLINNNSSPASRSLLKTALNNNNNGSSSSATIYYGWDGTMEQFFPEIFLRMVEILESVGWKLGAADPKRGGESILILRFHAYKNIAILHRPNLQAGLVNELKLKSEFEKLASLFNVSRLPVIITFSFTHKTSCDLMEYMTVVGDDEYARLVWQPELPEYLLKFTLGTALEYNEKQMSCSLPVVSVNNDGNSWLMMLLSVEFATEDGFPESYGLFGDLIKSAMGKNEKFLTLHGFTTNVKRFTRLELRSPSLSMSKHSHDHESGDNQKIATRYATLLSRFETKWSSEENEVATLIIEATAPIISSLRDNNVNVDNGIVPNVRNTVIPIWDPKNDCSNDSEISPQLAPLIAQRFNLLYFDLWRSSAKVGDCVSGLLQHRCSKPGSPTVVVSGRLCPSQFDVPGNNSSSPIKLLVAIDLDNSPPRSWNYEPDFKETLKLLKHHKKQTNNLQIEAILFNGQLSFEKFSQALDDFKGLAQHFGCVVKYNKNIAHGNIRSGLAVAELIFHSCKLSSGLSSKINFIIFDIEILLNDWARIDVSHYISQIKPKLSMVVSGVHILKQRFLALNVILKFPERLGHDGRGGSPTQQHNLFCNSVPQNVNKLVEALVSWSYIHNVSVILKNVISTDDAGLGWWDRLDAKTGSSRSDEAPPGAAAAVFVTRNHPKTMGYLKGDPCLERLQTPPQVPIRMFANGMGCSVRVPRKMVGGAGAEDLQTMLEFALHKFSYLEIIGIGDDPGQVVAPLERALLLTSPNQVRNIFIEVPLGKPGSRVEPIKLLAQQLEAFKFSKAKVSMQISNWGDEDVHDLEAFIKNSIPPGATLGLVIENCSASVVVDREILQTDTFPAHFSFLVCANSWTINYNNERNYYFESLGTALDQLYVIKTAFSRKFPDKEIYFRPEFIPPSNNTADFLRVVRDVNQHAELYNMKYSAINAFEIPSTDPGGSSSWRQGWWRVENSSDMANASNYFEQESEHLNLTTPWRPPPRENKAKEGTITTFSWWAFVPSVVGFIMAIVGLLVFLFSRRSKSRYLTRIEELEFLNGISHHDIMMDDNLDSAATANQFLNMKFDKKFEIPKTNLKSEEATIIGAGNFGIVYKAVVRGALVAVKIPKEGTSPDLFRTTLQEIKIMCHVGSHDNVVRFVGAYIREIGRGIVQVATELCENGTLLSHLRGLSRSIAETGESQALSQIVTTFDLDRFSLEIASGMEFLASKRVMHGDLATRNVFMDEHFTCKIGDFGLSRKLYEYEKYVKSSQEPLPWRWMAVEVLDKMEFSVKSDVWSYGITLWEIYSLGSVPYPGLNWTADFVTNLRSGLRLQKPEYSSDNLYGKLVDCWNIEAEARPNFSELCQYFRTLRESQYTTMEEDDDQEEPE